MSLLMLPLDQLLHSRLVLETCRGIKLYAAAGSQQQKDPVVHAFRVPRPLQKEATAEPQFLRCLFHEPQCVESARF